MLTEVEWCDIITKLFRERQRRQKKTRDWAWRPEKSFQKGVDKRKTA